MPDEDEERERITEYNQKNMITMYIVYACRCLARSNRAHIDYTSSYYVIDCILKLLVFALVCSYVQIRFKEYIRFFTHTFICEILSVCSRADRTDKNG